MRSPQRFDGTATSLLGLASAQRWLGYNKLARANLERGLELAEGAEAVAIQNALGEALMHRDKDAASELLNAAHQAAKTDAPDATSAVLLNLGNLAVMNRDHETAIEHFDAALARKPAALLAAQLHANLIAIAPEARAKDLLAHAGARKLPPSYASVVLLIKLGKLAQAAGDTNSANAFANSAIRTAGKLHPSARSQAARFAGHLAEKAGDQAEALRLTRQTLFLAQQIGNPHLLYRWRWQLGGLRSSQGELEPAIAAYEMAMKTVSVIRHDLSVGPWRQGRSYRDTIGPLHYGLADLHLQMAKRTGEVKHLHEARSVIKAFKSAELEDYFQDDCVNVSAVEEV